MADANGECCIARWGGGRHVSDRYNSSKMNMIMLKYRPIAPKPTTGNAVVSAASEGLTSGSGCQLAKGPASRGRKKKENNNSSGTSSTRSVRKCTSSNGRKRKSSSPENHDDDHDEAGNQKVGYDDKRADPTLLPLFPEAPDLSPTSKVQSMVPFCLNFDNTGSSPSFVHNYSNCHGSWWS